MSNRPQIQNMRRTTQRRNNYDVSNRIDTTDPAAVNAEINRIFAALYPKASIRVINRSVKDLVRLHLGEYPGYRPSDTGYHNLQHMLDVTLAMARLMDGYERSREGGEALGPQLFGFGIVTALFHDVGYLRHTSDTRHQKGAEYTLKHVTRGARFLSEYLGRLGMAKLAPVASRVIHFTGYERPTHKIRVPNATFRLLGHMLGTADIIAQMADRCYLEKCRDRLFEEFVDGGLAARDKTDRRASVRFKSAEDLVVKTPGFYKSAMTRLNEQLGGVYRYAETHFGGRNFYIETIYNSIPFAIKVSKERDLSLLRRLPPRAKA
ncbi:MAG TPA: HD domain-containing protein [Burkholderiales bacterium]|nr:HD domain-containing protein [Burkholderiales bacterium]